jgi:3-oxoacyl-[acyl-carrier protein] reductase
MTAQLGAEWRAKAVAESPLSRVATPEDVANAIVFLLSHSARHVTGHVLDVDGGQDM